MRPPYARRCLAASSYDYRLNVVDQQDRGEVHRHRPAQNRTRLRGRVACDSQLERRALLRTAPSGKRWAEQFGREHTLCPSLGPRDDLHDQVGNGARTRDSPGFRLGGTGRVAQGAAEAVEGFPLLRGQLGDQRGRVCRPIAGRAPREPERGGAADQALEGAIGVDARHPRGVGNGVAGRGTEPKQRGVRVGLGGREPERREIDLAWHSRSSDYYYANKLTARGMLEDVDGKRHQPGDESQPERRVRLPLRRALPGSLEWEVVRCEGVRRFGHGAQALRAPDPPLVALVEQPLEDAAGARNLAHQTEPSQELDPIERERDVAYMAMCVGVQPVAD